MKKIYTLAIAACMAIGANAQIYVVGSGQVDGNELGWTPEAPVTVEASEDGTYTFTYTQKGGFKMSTTMGNAADDTNDDWADFNVGLLFADIQTAEFTVGTPVEFTLENNVEAPNMMGPWEGNWKFVISADFMTMTVTALSEKPQGATPVYIRGGMENNNWLNRADDDTDETYAARMALWQFTSEDGVNYSFVAKGETMIPAGVSFKIADANWAAINYGGATDIWPSEDGDEWTFNGSDSYLAEDFEGTIKFELTGNNAPIMVQWFVDEFGGVEDIIVDENAPVEYYNLQGIKVESPANGLFIVKQGNKVAKQVIR